jgi:hypothetical protein
MLCCFPLGPGFCSMSPASNSINSTIEWFLCVLVGKVIGLRPAVDHLLFKTDVNR